jgi:hypothetical protein
MPDRVDTPTTEDRVMSLVVRFHPKNVTIAQYEEVVRREESGEAKFPPDARDYHICFGTDGDLRVSEIWDSREQFQAYGEVLMPILADVGIQFSGEPEVFEVHNIIKR